MIKEYNMCELNESNILDLVKDVYISGFPLIIRSAISKNFTKTDWIELLKKEWLHDKRHFTHDSKLSESDWWEITNKKEFESAYAYSHTAQPFHTDNAWFNNPPEINLFLKQRQAKSGGEQLIYMLDDLILDLKKQNPDLLEALISTEVVIKKGDEDFENRTTIIRPGKPNTVFWNFYRTRANHGGLSKMLNDFFEFLNLQRESESIYRIRLDDGDCLINNDVRSLHARESFYVAEDGERSLLQSMWKLP